MITHTITTPNTVLVLDKPGQYLVELTKPGAEVVISGVFQVSGSESVQIHVIIHHKAPRTRANTTIKAVAKDKGRVDILGRIIIDENCGQTNSFLTERVLLLSPTASAQAVPDLEIKTDDVKCSHAATISYIPEEQLFYLQARGLTKTQAEDMIVEGFLEL